MPLYLFPPSLLCSDFLSHLFQTLSQQNVKVTAVSSMLAAKTNATLPSGKKTKIPAVPAVSRVSENLSSDPSEHNMLAGKVMIEETKVGSFPGGRERMGLLGSGLVPHPQLRDECVHEASREGLLYAMR